MAPSASKARRSAANVAHGRTTINLPQTPPASPARQQERAQAWRLCARLPLRNVGPSANCCSNRASCSCGSVASADDPGNERHCVSTVSTVCAIDAILSSQQRCLDPLILMADVTDDADRTDGAFISSYSCASPFGPAILVTHDPKPTSPHCSKPRPSAGFTGAGGGGCVSRKRGNLCPRAQGRRRRK